MNIYDFQVGNGKGLSSGPWEEGSGAHSLWHTQDPYERHDLPTGKSIKK